MRLLLVFPVVLAACARHIEPVEVVLSAEEAQRERGKYLTEAVMACGSCHAQRDYGRVGAPPREGTELAGSQDIAPAEGFSARFSFSAPNLTPHHLGSWSDGEVARAIVFGQSKDRRGLFPYMPYFEYREALAKDDLAAVVAYLRSLPPVAFDSPAPPRFPVPRFVMDRFPEGRTLRDKAPGPTAPDHGKYLTEIAGCMGCHTAADRRGQPVGPAYAGGREFPVPPPGRGTVRSANLTPDDETGLGRWTREQFITRFRSATVAAAAPVEAGGFNTMMPWWAWARMREEDLGAMYDFLRSLPAVKNEVVKYTP